MSFLLETRSLLQLTVHCHSHADVLFSIYEFFNRLLFWHSHSIKNEIT